jgi:hypothetical protein
LRNKIQRINFNVIHIVNSPTGFVSPVEKVAPVVNDLMSPVLTIVGAYDMQTTVNDKRLVNYLSDINNAKTNIATYTQISLYLKPEEIKNENDIKMEREKPYAMNWFMSDYTRNRIDARLVTNPQLKSSIDSMH